MHSWVKQSLFGGWSLSVVSEKGKVLGLQCVLERMRSRSGVHAQHMFSLMHVYMTSIYDFHHDLRVYMTSNTGLDTDRSHLGARSHGRGQLAWMHASAYYPCASRLFLSVTMTWHRLISCQQLQKTFC